MEYISNTLGNLVEQTAFMNLTFGNLIMIAVACFFLYLAIRHGFEPLLLVPIAFGMLLVNIYPDIMLHAEDSANGTGGLLYYFYVLDEWSILPSLIFLGVGAMTDFGPLIANPKSFLLGAVVNPAVSDIPWCRCDDRLWTIDREPEEFPSGCGSTVWYFRRIPWSNGNGIL